MKAASCHARAAMSIPQTLRAPKSGAQQVRASAPAGDCRLSIAPAPRLAPDLGPPNLAAGSTTAANMTASPERGAARTLRQSGPASTKKLRRSLRPRRTECGGVADNTCDSALAPDADVGNNLPAGFNLKGATAQRQQRGADPEAQQQGGGAAHQPATVSHGAFPG